MKKLFIALLLVLLPAMMFAQANAFTKFEDRNGITSVIVNKKMFELIKDVDNFKILSTSENKHIKSLKKAVASYLKNDGLEQMLSVNGDGAKFQVFVKEGKGLLKEALVSVEDKDGKLVVITFSGNIDLKGMKDIQ